MSESQISPELRAFAAEFARQVREANCEEHRRATAELRDLFESRLDAFATRVEARIAELRAELRGEVAGVRKDLGSLWNEQREQRGTLENHSRTLARVEERLAVGERRFDRLETQAEEQRRDTGENRLSLVQLAARISTNAGVGGIAGAAGAFILKSLGG